MNLFGIDFVYIRITYIEPRFYLEGFWNSRWSFEYLCQDQRTFL